MKQVQQLPQQKALNISLRYANEQRPLTTKQSSPINKNDQQIITKSGKTAENQLSNQGRQQHHFTANNMLFRPISSSKIQNENNQNLNSQDIKQSSRRFKENRDHLSNENNQKQDHNLENEQQINQFLQLQSQEQQKQLINPLTNEGLRLQQRSWDIRTKEVFNKQQNNDSRLIVGFDRKSSMPNLNTAIIVSDTKRRIGSSHNSTHDNSINPMLKNRSLKFLEKELIAERKTSLHLLNSSKQFKFLDRHADSFSSLHQSNASSFLRSAQKKSASEKRLTVEKRVSKKLRIYSQLKKQVFHEQMTSQLQPTESLGQQQQKTGIYSEKEEQQRKKIMEEKKEQGQKFEAQKQAVSQYLQCQQVDPQIIKESKTLFKGNSKHLHGLHQSSEDLDSKRKNEKNRPHSALVGLIGIENMQFGKQKVPDEPIKIKMKEYLERFLKGEQQYFSVLGKTQQAGLKLFKESVELSQKFYYDQIEKAPSQFNQCSDLKTQKRFRVLKAEQFSLNILSPTNPYIQTTTEETNQLKRVGRKSGNLRISFSRAVNDNAGFEGATPKEENNNVSTESILMNKVEDQVNQLEQFLDNIQTSKEGFERNLYLSKQFKHFLELVKSDHQQEIIKLLDQRPQLVNEAIDHLGQTALHWAAKRGNLPLTQLLINRGANIRAADINGKTASQLAASLNQTQTMSLLKKEQAFQKAERNSFAVDETPNQSRLSLLSGQESSPFIQNTPFGDKAVLQVPKSFFQNYAAQAEMSAKFKKQQNQKKDNTKINPS